MLDKNIFGERLKALRSDLKISQTTLGDVLEVTKTQISDMENGKASTTLEKACILASYFNVSIDYLVGRTDNQIVNK